MGMFSSVKRQLATRFAEPGPLTDPTYIANNSDGHSWMEIEDGSVSIYVRDVGLALDDNPCKIPLPPNINGVELYKWLDENASALHRLEEEVSALSEEGETGWKERVYEAIAPFEDRLWNEVSQIPVVGEQELIERARKALPNWEGGDLYDMAMDTVDKSIEAIRGVRGETFNNLYPKRMDALENMVLEEMERGTPMQASAVDAILELGLTVEKLEAVNNYSPIDPDRATELLWQFEYYGEDSDTLAKILELGADANSATRNGETRLFHMDDPEMVQLLLDHGADPRIANADGITAREHREIKLEKHEVRDYDDSKQCIELIREKEIALDRQEMSQAIEEHLDTWTPSSVNGEAMQRDVAGIEVEEQVVFERRESRARKM